MAGVLCTVCGAVVYFVFAKQTLVQTSLLSVYTTAQTDNSHYTFAYGKYIDRCLLCSQLLVSRPHR